MDNFGPWHAKPIKILSRPSIIGMPHHKPLTPAGFVPPERIVTDQFVLRPLKYADAERDYDAWSTSIDHLRGVFGPHSAWPRPDMTLEENAIDLAWHQREHEMKSSFAYTVLSNPTETTCIGSCT